MRGLGIILWGFVLMMLVFDSLVVPCVVYGIAVAVGLVIGIRKVIKEKSNMANHLVTINNVIAQVGKLEAEVEKVRDRI